jgi:hypothetical protein
LNARKFDLLTPEGKGIIGELDESGVLTFAVDAGPGSSIRGTELFNRIMLHFGDDVKAIHGVWCKGPLGLPSTNIDKVNELTATGMVLGEAIYHAWTVTRAKKLGFLRVNVLGTPAGHPGAFTKIDVLIEK